MPGMDGFQVMENLKEIETGSYPLGEAITRAATPGVEENANVCRLVERSCLVLDCHDGYNHEDR
jgi:CheY-like chemotaxis protein